MSTVVEDAAHAGVQRVRHFVSALAGWVAFYAGMFFWLWLAGGAGNDRSGPALLWEPIAASVRLATAWPPAWVDVGSLVAGGLATGVLAYATLENRLRGRTRMMLDRFQRKTGQNVVLWLAVFVAVASIVSTVLLVMVARAFVTAWRWAA